MSRSASLRPSVVRHPLKRDPLGARPGVAMNTQNDALATRLDRLERSNARLRSGIALCGLAALVLGSRQQPSSIVEAQQFVLKDRTGRTRGQFGVARSGLVSLTIGTASGSYVELGAMPNGDARLYLLASGAGRRSSWVEVAARDLFDSTAYIDIAQSAGDAPTGTRIETRPNGTSSLYIYRARMSPGATALDSTRRVVEWTRFPRALLRVDSAGSSSLALYGDSLALRAMLAAPSLASSQLNALPPAALLLFGRDGKATWSAP